MEHINKLLYDKNFRELENHLRRFNVFEATDMKRREVKHTKFLAYLLDPMQPHGLSSDLLKTLMLIIASPEEPMPLLDMDLSCTKVHTEYQLTDKKAIDILIMIASRSNIDRPYIIGIENKLDSKQGMNQLKYYAEDIDRKFEIKTKEKNGADYIDRTHIRLFYLVDNEDTPNKDDEEKWTRITYKEHVCEAIRIVMTSQKEVMSDYLYSLLNDYIEMIDEESNEEIETLALAIIEKHPNSVANIKEIKKCPFGGLEWRFINEYSKAIDYLKTIETDPRAPILKEFERCISKSGFDYEHSDLKFFRFSFLGEHEDAIKKISSEKWLKSRRNLAGEFCIRLTDEKFAYFSCKLVLGPTEIPLEERGKLVSMLRAKFNYKRKYKEVSNTWSTILNFENSATVEFKDKSELSAKAIEYINNVLDHIATKISPQLHEVLNEYFSIEIPERMHTRPMLAS